MLGYDRMRNLQKRLFDNMKSLKIKFLLILVVTQVCFHEAALGHPHGDLKKVEINYYVTKPPAEYSSSLNNVGSFNASQGKIFTCLMPYTNGVLSPIDGVSEFSIAFNIISGADGKIGVSESGTFNSAGNVGSDGARLSCSGSYETTTGIYKDTILVNSSLIETSFQLIDPTMLAFNLLSAKTLDKSPALSPVEFNPKKNSKTMDVKNGITVVFNRSIFRADGKIELINVDSGAAEEFDIKDSKKVSVDGTKLVLNPEKALISDKNYRVRIPVGALKDSEGNGFTGLDNYNFKTQIDIAFLLVGYNNTTLYETVESFEPSAKKSMSFLSSLSAGQISSYKTYRLTNISISDAYAKSLGHLEAVNSALDGWGVDELTNYFRDKIGHPDALQNPTVQQREVLQELRQWLLDNQKGAEEWAESALGIQHYSDWVNDKVLNFSRPVYFLLDNLKLPAEFVPQEHKVISFIFSDPGKTNFSALASNFNALGGSQWSIKTADGLKVTHDQDFFYSDHSDPFGDTAAELLLNINTRVDVHEVIHTWGHAGHDTDPLMVGYSTMSQAGGDADLQFRRDPPTYPIYNRVYLMGWMPESAITSDASLIRDAADPIVLGQKYLLKVGRFKYQELYDGQWFQYSVPSLERQLNTCKTVSIVTAPTATNPKYDAGNLCKPILRDKNCGIKSEIFGLPETMWDFRNCEFIDIDAELSRELFRSYLENFDGEYNSAINFDALVMEQTDASLRSSSN